jgi:hypothetical protein
MRRRGCSRRIVRVDGKYVRRLSKKDHYPRKAELAEWLSQQDCDSLA